MNSKSPNVLQIGLLFSIFFLLSMGSSMVRNGEVSTIASILGLLGILIVGAIYFIPSIVARRNNHTQTTAITLLNVFLGWTFIGWVVALIWTAMKEKNT